MESPKQGRCHTLMEKIFSRKKKKIEKKKISQISQKTNCRRKKKSRKTQDFNRND